MLDFSIIFYITVPLILWVIAEKIYKKKDIQAMIKIHMYEDKDHNKLSPEHLKLWNDIKQFILGGNIQSKDQADMVDLLHVIQFTRNQTYSADRLNNDFKKIKNRRSKKKKAS